MDGVCHKSEIRKSEIFLSAGIDELWGVLPDASMIADVQLMQVH
jgi:hypothetical protein